MEEEIKKIINRIDFNWSKDLIIRFLYVKLAPLFSRDPIFFLATPNMQLQMYNSGYRGHKRYVICKSLCEIYHEVYNRVGIKSIIINTNEKEVPHFALIVEGDRGFFYIDPLKDLFPNQLGIETNLFGNIPSVCKDYILKCYPDLITLPDDYVKSLDQKMNIHEFNMYISKMFRILHKEMVNYYKAHELFGIPERCDYFAIANKKIEFANSALINLGTIPGLIERKHLYSYIKKYTFTPSERKIVKTEINLRDGLMLVVNDGTNYARYHEEEKDGIYTLKRVK